MHFDHDGDGAHFVIPSRQTISTDVYYLSLNALYERPSREGKHDKGQNSGLFYDTLLS